MARDLSNIRVMLSANRMDLVPQFGDIYWREWGDYNHPGRRDLTWWVETALNEASGRSEPPVSFLAVDFNDNVIGGVALSATESGIENHDDWTPWVTGMIVKPEWRSNGVGQLLLNALDNWIVTACIPATWIVTGGDRADTRAVTFYERCGWSVVDGARHTDNAVVLRKQYGHR